MQVNQANWKGCIIHWPLPPSTQPENLLPVSSDLCMQALQDQVPKISVSFKEQLLQLSLEKKGILNMKYVSWDASFFPWNVNSGNKYFFLF